MKQYLNESQTAKLIELGFEKPNGSHSYWRGNELVINNSYSIVELIGMLPEAICQSNDEDTHYFLSIETDSCLWKVFYEDECEDVLCSTYGVNLIDALYDMVTMLKKEGTI